MHTADVEDSETAGQVVCRIHSEQTQSRHCRRMHPTLCSPPSERRHVVRTHAHAYAHRYVTETAIIDSKSIFTVASLPTDQCQRQCIDSHSASSVVAGAPVSCERKCL